ncbi:MAG: hypothetical protein HFJ10_02950 [Lachnospiraceae bacterium]|jgi:hypothetical protein|nr:hypothetical protein [Lachnospiraceae bacterium]
MKRISKGMVMTAVFTAIFNIRCIRAHYKAIKTRNQKRESLQAIADYRRKRLDEEWETCNEMIEKMEETAKKPVQKPKKKKTIFSRNISLGKQYFKLCGDAVLGKV